MSKVHLVATVQTRAVGQTSDKSLNSLAQSLTPSAAAFKAAAIAAGYLKPDDPKDNPDQDSENANAEKSTIAVHGDAEAEDVIQGFCKFDSANADTEAYIAKRAAYDEVRGKYPSDLKNMLRDNKVKALKDINRVGFNYYAVKIEAFTEVEGGSKVIKSKTHHRMEKMSRASLQRILKDVFNAEIRPEVTKGKSESEEGKTSESASEDS